MMIISMDYTDGRIRAVAIDAQHGLAQYTWTATETTRLRPSGDNWRVAEHQTKETT